MWSVRRFSKFEIIVNNNWNIWFIFILVSRDKWLDFEGWWVFGKGRFVGIGWVMLKILFCFLGWDKCLRGYWFDFFGGE